MSSLTPKYMWVHCTFQTKITESDIYGNCWSGSSSCPLIASLFKSFVLLFVNFFQRIFCSVLQEQYRQATYPCLNCKTRYSLRLWVSKLSEPNRAFPKFSKMAGAEVPQRSRHDFLHRNDLSFQNYYSPFGVWLRVSLLPYLVSPRGTSVLLLRLEACPVEYGFPGFGPRTVLA